MYPDTPRHCSRLPVYLYSGFREFLPGERHINQSLPVYVLLIMSSGTLYFREDGVDITLNKDEYYIQRANSVLEGIVPSLLPKYFYLCFSDATLTDNFQGIPLRGKCSYEQLASKINRLHLAYLSPSSDMINEAFYFYDLILALKGNHLPPPKPFVANATTLLQKNFRSHIDLESIAKAANCSVNYLIREFKAYHGLTPYQYILNLRIENAKSLLTSSNATLPEIALTSGFSDVISLHRAFVHKLGQTPGKYRKQYTSARFAPPPVENDNE